MAESATHEVDLVVFEAGGRRLAADAWVVTRIERRREGMASASVGSLPDASRALIVNAGGGDVQLPIDRLLGFERVSPMVLRRVPPFARPLASPAVAGAWLDSEAIVLLIDLVALVKQSSGGGSTAPFVSPQAT